MADLRNTLLFRALALPVCLSLATLAGCGKTGDLYLPEAGTTGEVVTRPTQTPPPDPSETSDSPQSVDSPTQPANPAPEVTGPEKDDKKENPGNPPR